MAVFLELALTGVTSAALAAARAADRRTVLLSQDPGSYDRRLPDPPELDEVRTADLSSTARVVDLCRRLEAEAVIALDHDHQRLAAEVREALGLPGPPAKGIITCLEKDRTREAVRGIGREVAARVLGPDEQPAGSPFGYPCIVKPSVGSASDGVTLCENDSSFRSACERARAVVPRRADGQGSVLVEEYVEGPELSAELLWDSRAEQWQLAGCTATSLSPPPVRREVGHLFPAALDPADLRALQVVLPAWLEAVGLSGGVAHVEFILTSSGPALVEINPRLAGGDIPRLVLYTTGIDLAAHYVALHLGLENQVTTPVSYRGAAATWFVSPATDGILTAVRWPDDIDAEVRMRAGMTGCRVTRQSRVGQMTVHAGDGRRAIAQAEKAAARAVVEIR